MGPSVEATIAATSVPTGTSVTVPKAPRFDRNRVGVSSTTMGTVAESSAPTAAPTKKRVPARNNHAPSGERAPAPVPSEKTTIDTSMSGLRPTRSPMDPAANEPKTPPTPAASNTIATWPKSRFHSGPTIATTNEMRKKSKNSNIVLIIIVATMAQ
jgi:hypothetical protein